MQIYTLKDLADHCYQQWLTTNRTDLPSGAIGWLRDSPVEPPLAGQIGEIFAADIEPSEKCYRFLKLTGVIERERLIQLLRKQVLDELDNGGEQKLSEVDLQWWAKVDEQRQRIFNKPDETAFSFFWFVIFFAIICGFVGAIIGHNSESMSADIGWRAGLIIWAIAAYGYRRLRASTLTEQFMNSAQEGIETQKRGIDESIRDRKANIDKDLPQLINKFYMPLSVDSQKSSNVSTSGTSLATKTSHKYRYAGLVATLGLLLVFSPSYIISNSNQYITDTTSAPASIPASAPSPAAPYGYVNDPDRGWVPASTSAPTSAPVEAPAPISASIEAPAPASALEEPKVGDTFSETERFVFAKLTALDKKTNLMWTRNADIANTKMTWDAAHEFAKRLNSMGYAGYRDWRLPSKEDLLTHVSYANGRGVTYDLQNFFNSIGFTNVRSWDYWSSTTSAGDPSDAWYVWIGTGGASYDGKYFAKCAWFVRAVQ